MFNSHLNFSLLFLHFLLFQFSSKVSSIRKDISLQVREVCRTTVQGRYLLSDDYGHVCDAMSVNPQTRCCPRKGEQFSCHGCNLVSQCCNSYEYCVSCCLNPARTQSEQALKVKIAKPVTAGTYASVFDFCAGRCRHSSESVVHENAYLSNFHHCFSLSSNSSGATDAHLEAKLVGINVVVGRQGESCDSVCKSIGESCIPNKLLVLNQCEIMQKYFSCKGGCFTSVGADQPAEVVDDAPRHLPKLRIQERAYTPKHEQFLLAMVRIGIQGDFAPVRNDFLEMLPELLTLIIVEISYALCCFPF